MPVRSTSTSTDLLPFHQSRATSPLSPGLILAAFSVRRVWRSTPAASASALYSAGVQFSTNHWKWSPTQLWPASYPKNPSMMPSSTTPHIPGTSCSLSPRSMWHVDVPIMASILPGDVIPTAGIDTWASTLATATAVPSLSPVSMAAAAVISPAFVPAGRRVRESFSSTRFTIFGCSAPKKSFEGYPSCLCHMAL